jgi:hypothetical protein
MIARDVIARDIQEAPLMKVFGAVGIALLFLLMGTGVSVYAQDQRDDAKPQAQEEKDKQEDKAAKQDEKKDKDQDVRRDDKEVRHDEKAEQNEHHEAVDEHRADAHRIPDDKFRAHFGSAHTFRIGHPVIVAGRPQFSYGGYSFVMVDPWPVGWAYTDMVYVDFIDGAYYLISPVHPGVRIVVNVVM